MTQLFSNNASTTLSSALTAIATSMSVVAGDGALFEAPTGGNYELITLTDGTNIEIVKATARSTDAFTITRAQEGTTAQAWAAGTIVEARLTAATLDQFPQGFDNAGNAKGTSAVNLQSGRASVSAVASGVRSVAVGYNCTASTESAVAIGENASSAGYIAISMGVDSSAAGNNSVAIGAGAKSNNAGDTALGYQSVVAAGTGGYNLSIGYQSVIGANATYSVSIGNGAGVSAGVDYGVAIGPWSAARADRSVAIGYGMVNDVPDTHTMTGLSLCIKDYVSITDDEHMWYAGSQSVVFSKEINLKTLADNTATITIPAGATFYPDEIGLIITVADTVTGQPSVSFGITGNTVALLASTATTKSAVKGRDIFTLLSKDGINSLTASVKTAATATALSGRFYWKGVLVEDQ